MFYCLVLFEKGRLHYVSKIEKTSFEVITEKEVENNGQALFLTKQRALIYANDFCKAGYNILIKPILKKN